MWNLFWLFYSSSALVAQDQQPVLQPPQPRTSPQVVQQQLQAAEAKFKHAEEMFNPWYTGPLITPSATMVPPGQAMWQPYLYFADTYARFDEDRKSIDIPSVYSLNPVPVIVQVGVTPSLDTIVIMGTVANWSEGKCGGGFQDTNIGIGFKIQGETRYVPKAKFSITQSFPTGKYKDLDPTKLGLDATGAGAWQTQFTLTFGKVLFWDTKHPMNTRASFNYKVSTPISVSNFNAYGGGYGTDGRVHPGNYFAADLGLEVSINQPWVAALDVVYNCTTSTSFSGASGFADKAMTIPAGVGGGFSDQLSLAPAIEYNFNENMGLLWGAWFTVYGRNAGNFVQGIFSWYWEFP